MEQGDEEEDEDDEHYADTGTTRVHADHRGEDDHQVENVLTDGDDGSEEGRLGALQKNGGHQDLHKDEVGETDGPKELKRHEVDDAPNPKRTKRLGNAGRSGKG
jgi:hypothetical protein